MQQHRPRLSVAQIDTLIDALCIAANEAHSSAQEAFDAKDWMLELQFRSEAYRYETMLEKLSFPVMPVVEPAWQDDPSQWSIR